MPPGFDHAAAHNGNIERTVPGITDRARGVLEGGAIPPTAMQSSNFLPGRETMVVIPSFHELRVKIRGQYGMFRSNTLIVPEFWAYEVGGQVMVVSESLDPNTGGNLKKVMEHKLLPESKLLQVIPTMQDFEELWSPMEIAMVTRKYLIPGPEIQDYTECYKMPMMELMAVWRKYGDKGLIAVILLDRELRIQQFKVGYSWRHAFNKAIVDDAGRALAAKTSPALAAPSTSSSSPAAPAAPVGAWRPQKGAKYCFKYAKGSACDKGANCEFASTHHCLRCNAADHGFERCLRGGAQA
jgi:hypothetical protein